MCLPFNALKLKREVVKIFAGFESSAAITGRPPPPPAWLLNLEDNDDVFAWGSNVGHRLGLKEGGGLIAAPQMAPRKSPTLGRRGLKQISFGQLHTAATTGGPGGGGCSKSLTNFCLFLAALKRQVAAICSFGGRTRRVRSGRATKMHPPPPSCRFDTP
jgi:hypothetical protein